MPTQTFFDLREEKRNRILSAARKVFMSVPYEKVTIQSIIEAANIPRGSFYQYFTDKDDLYLYCQKELIKKSVDITYGENLDFLWGELYNNMLPEKREETPWYQTAIEHLKKEMSEDEYQFAMSPPPKSAFRELCFETASATYPYFRKHIKDINITRNLEKQNLLSFQFSLYSLLAYEYEAMCGVSSADARHAVATINRALVEAFRDICSDKPTDVLQTLTGLRCLSDSGLNLTCVVAPNRVPSENGESDEITKTAGSFLRIPIQVGSLSGRLACDVALTADKLHETDKDDCLCIELVGNQRAMCMLTAYGKTYPLGDRVTVIGTTAKGEKLCIMENGEFLL